MDGIRVHDTSPPVSGDIHSTTVETTPLAPFLQFVANLGEDYSNVQNTEQEDQLKFVYGWLKDEVDSDDPSLLADTAMNIRTSFGQDGGVAGSDSWLSKLHRYAVLKTKAKTTFNEIDNLRKNANSNTTPPERRDSGDSREGVQGSVGQEDRGRGEDRGASIQGNRNIPKEGGVTEISVRFN